MVAAREPEQSPLPEFNDIADLTRFGASMRTVNAFRRNGIFDIERLSDVLAAYDWDGGWKQPDFNPVGLGTGTVDEARAALRAYRKRPKRKRRSP